MDGNSRTVFSYFPRAGIIQPKFIAAAQLRKILSKNAVTAAPALHCAVSLKAPVRSRAHRAGRRAAAARREFQSRRCYHREHADVSRLIAANYRFVTMRPASAHFQRHSRTCINVRLTTPARFLASFNGRGPISFFNAGRDNAREAGQEKTGQSEGV